MLLLGARLPTAIMQHGIGMEATCIRTCNRTPAARVFKAIQFISSSVGCNRAHAQTQQDLDEITFERGIVAIASMFYQTSGVRETRVRGGAAIWPNLRGRGGVRRRTGKQSRGARLGGLGARRTWIYLDIFLSTGPAVSMSG